MIDAEHKSEERYSKLSIAYETQEEEEKVVTATNQVIEHHTIKPEIYTSALTGNKKVLVIEYHDDCDREAGAIFDDILQKLSITRC